MKDPSRIRRIKSIARIEFNLPDCSSSAVWESGDKPDKKLREAIKAARTVFFKHWYKKDAPVKEKP